MCCGVCCKGFILLGCVHIKGLETGGHNRGNKTILLPISSRCSTPVTSDLGVSLFCSPSLVWVPNSHDSVGQLWEQFQPTETGQVFREPFTHFHLLVESASTPWDKSFLPTQVPRPCRAPFLLSKGPPSSVTYVALWYEGRTTVWWFWSCTTSWSCTGSGPVQPAV